MGYSSDTLLFYGIKIKRTDENLRKILGDDYENYMNKDIKNEFENDDDYQDALEEYEHDLQMYQKSWEELDDYIKELYLEDNEEDEVKAKTSFIINAKDFLNQDKPSKSLVSDYFELDEDTIPQNKFCMEGSNEPTPLIFLGNSIYIAISNVEIIDLYRVDYATGYLSNITEKLHQWNINAKKSFYSLDNKKISFLDSEPRVYCLCIPENDRSDQTVARTINLNRF